MKVAALLGLRGILGRFGRPGILRLKIAASYSSPRGAYSERQPVPAAFSIRAQRNHCTTTAVEPFTPRSGE